MSHELEQLSDGSLFCASCARGEKYSVVMGESGAQRAVTPPSSDIGGSTPSATTASRYVAQFDIKPFVFLDRKPEGSDETVQGLMSIPEEFLGDREYVRREARAFFDSMLDLWLGPRAR